MYRFLVLLKQTKNKQTQKHIRLMPLKFTKSLKLLRFLFISIVYLRNHQGVARVIASNTYFKHYASEHRYACTQIKTSVFIPFVFVRQATHTPSAQELR